MHKKISVGLTVAITAVAVVIAVIVTTAVTMNIYSSLIADLPEREAMYSSLSELDSIVRNEYYGELDSNAVNDAISGGYLSALTVGDNYIMSEDEYSAYKIKQTGAEKSVEYKKYSGVGYIRISDFTDTTPAEFSEAVTSLKNDSVTGIVIDVRNTASINIDSATAVIDKIVPLATQGTQSIATATDKNNTNAVVFSADSENIDMTFSVIVNEKTSGAGELLACDIRDFGKGTVVGKTTAGNGSYQQIFELSDGSALVLTTAKLLPYTSECYDGVGVKPDYEVNAGNSDSLDKDNQFLQAYASVTSLQR